ncbi:carbon starvation protein A [uncultured Endozoicomonas sp.]|uniref:carbon starvation CstA family protein n=1 Tax=uncultured Endozoicomonas sp. TaxID=432652 RepID=UPI00263870F0|nr:carbon starvation protein A [uncultured Endozoicomonas sp.]
MISFICALAILIGGYLTYGKWVERQFGADPDRPTPAITHNDGVDFVPLSWKKIFLIQFLNIAGLGPIFGAILGALYGPIAFLWIAFGCILGGGVHDYFSGMLSIRHEGKSIPEIVGHYMGDNTRLVIRGFTVVLLLLVGVVFMVGPAELLASLGMGGVFAKSGFWLGVILFYYFIATILPIDKVIARIYPVFGITLLIMAFGVGGMMLFNDLPIPEITASHLHPDNLPAWPMLFVTIACGAISGFHATQSPLMSRCLPTEAYGRRVFFGAMVAEGIVALIWAAAAMSFFPNGIGGLAETLNKGGAGLVVNEISMGLLGSFGGLLAILGVIACPITSGDTAFRSIRLIFADAFKLNQTSILSRLLLATPVFGFGLALAFVDFNVIWRYFAFSNQALATIVLWTSAIFMVHHGKRHWIASLPATFMTAVCATYLLIAREGLNLPTSIGYPLGILLALGCLVWFSFSSQKEESPTSSSSPSV